MAQSVQKEGFEVLEAATGEAALDLVRDQHPDAALVDILLPDYHGTELYQKIKSLDPSLPVVFVTASGSSNLAIQAMRLGALDYLVKPLRVADIRRAVRHAIDVRRMATSQQPAKRSDRVQSTEGDLMIGHSPAMQKVYKDIGLVASQDVTVLIRGESGTGKELVARAIHQFSPRADHPFVAVNCAAIPETLLESELFGHEKGSFTGAERRRVGRFEQCDGGTIFLDEIGDMPLLLQSKLLRVLQEKSFERVGGNQTIHVDVRIVAATNQDLERMVAEKHFREDLFYRLNGYTIFLPPLRERGADVDVLTEHFRRLANQELQKDVREVSPDAREIIHRYPWPGNVRELQNAMFQAVLKSTGPVLIPEFLPDHIVASVTASDAGMSDAGMSDAGMSDRGRESSDGEVRPPSTDPLDAWLDERIARRRSQLYDEVIGEVERRLVTRLLAATGGDRQAAIERLGLNPTQFRSPAGLLLVDSDQAASAADSLIRPGMTISAIEREAIRRALEQTGGKRTEAARMLGISVRTLQRKIKEFQLDR